MQIDKRILYIILGFFILRNMAGLITDTAALLILLLSLPAVLVAITFHEFAHAFVADKLGDDTARKQGRLNLNPLSHLDPIGTIMLIFAGFGWGKPVEINPRNFNKNIKSQMGEALVSIAGPLMNFILVIIFLIIYASIKRFAPEFAMTQVGSIIVVLVRNCVIVNLGLGVFNLIPLPPLDGSKIVGSFLPYSVKNWLEKYYNIFYIIFIVIWITGLAGIIISPVIDIIYTGLISLVSAIFGVYLI